MKRFLLLLLALCPLLLVGQSFTRTAAFRGAAVKKVATSSCDSCTSGLLFAWHAEDTDVAAGTPCGCSVGDTTATLASGAVISTDQAKDGTHSLSIPTANDYASFDWSNSDILNPNRGTIDFWIYWVSGTPSFLIDLPIDGANRLIVRLDSGSGYIYMQHIAGGTGRSASSTDSSISVGNWYHIKCRWDTTAHDGLYLKTTCDTTTGEANSTGNGRDALGTFAGTSGTLKFGDTEGYGGVFFLDNIKIYDSWQ